MATFTPNLGLVKPEPDDFYDVDIFNGNFEKIDSSVSSLFSDNAGAHNSVFRGKDITNYYDDGSLWSRISSGEFTDLFIGDYIVKNNTTWRIAAFDYYYNRGVLASEKHHVIIVPDTKLTTEKMNDTDSTTGGFAASKMYKTTLREVSTTYIEPIFGGHVLEANIKLTNGLNSTGYNRMGTNTGCPGKNGWYPITVNLMSEIQIFGSVSWASTGYETGYDYLQFPLFALSPQFINANSAYWLRTIVDSSNYSTVNNKASDFAVASRDTYGIRPYFLID